MPGIGKTVGRSTRMEVYRTANDWPTFAGAQSRSPSASALGQTLVPVWERPISLSPPWFQRRMVQLVQGGAPPPQAAMMRNARLAAFPVVLATTWCCSLTPSAFTPPALPPASPLSCRRHDLSQPSRRRRSNNRARFPRLSGQGSRMDMPRLTLNVFEQIAYARVGELATSRGTNRSRTG